MAILEICIDHLAAARAARDGGAQRIEVCGALEVGGVTPSPGLVQQCLELGGIEVVVLIRPHAGDFCYGDDDLATMLRDVELARRMGAHGVALGAVDRERRVARDVCARFIDVARPLQVTFHRAFDVVADPLEALNTLLALKIDRLLTSGQQPTAWQGAGLIRQLVTRASGRLAIMAGGGIRADNIVDLVRATGVGEVHSSARTVPAAATPDRLGLVHVAGGATPASVRALRAALFAAGQAPAAPKR